MIIVMDTWQCHKIEYLRISKCVYKIIIRTGVSWGKLRIWMNKIGLYNAKYRWRSEEEEKQNQSGGINTIF